MRQPLLLVAGLLAAGNAFVAACSTGPNADGEAVVWRPAPAAPSIDAKNHSTNPNVPSRFPPGTRIALGLEPRAPSGIPLPSGVCLPALNGVPKSGVVDRPPAHGPVPQVIGIAVDDAQLEWYEHADGSMTTSRFLWNEKTSRWEPMTFHAIAAR